MANGKNEDNLSNFEDTVLYLRNLTKNQMHHKNRFTSNMLQYMYEGRKAASIYTCIYIYIHTN